jgi:hypothetical protein
MGPKRLCSRSAAAVHESRRRCSATASQRTKRRQIQRSGLRDGAAAHEEQKSER